MCGVGKLNTRGEVARQKHPRTKHEGSAGPHVYTNVKTFPSQRRHCPHDQPLSGGASQQGIVTSGGPSRSNKFDHGRRDFGCGRTQRYLHQPDGQFLHAVMGSKLCIQKHAQN
ncbi:hypothetical protein PSHT_15511 [Puccinia striiformis]|uniref:Uncharacterized protein n=1 Tax=Puccinia striiformis TaxID=27350 RepID=A0A2S4UEE9_9BASI|nr:hypothetical protein PSHT_15511 [Puccinia striiformis]